MTATISPEIVQAAFGLGNLTSARWLAIQGLSGQATTEDMEMFARKGVFSSIGRASAVATVVAVALTAVEPSMAFVAVKPVATVAAPLLPSGQLAPVGIRDGPSQPRGPPTLV